MRPNVDVPHFYKDPRANPTINVLVAKISDPRVPQPVITGLHVATPHPPQTARTTTVPSPRELHGHNGFMSRSARARLATTWPTSVLLLVVPTHLYP